MSEFAERMRRARFTPDHDTLFDSVHELEVYADDIERTCVYPKSGGHTIVRSPFTRRAAANMLPAKELGR